MPDQHLKKLSGSITDVFAHRFVVQTPNETILADLGPKGLGAVVVQAGDHVVLDGEMKPSELKVTRISRNGGAPIDIEHKKKPHEHKDHAHHPDADPNAAVRAAKSAGFSPMGEPRRKPKHFEILARKDDTFFELHVEFDGHIRKEKPVAAGDPKWSDELGSAA